MVVKAIECNDQHLHVDIMVWKHFLTVRVTNETLKCKTLDYRSDDRKWRRQPVLLMAEIQVMAVAQLLGST